MNWCDDVSGLSRDFQSGKTQLGAGASGAAIDALDDITSDRLAGFQLFDSLSQVDIGQLIVDEARAAARDGIAGLLLFGLLAGAVFTGIVAYMGAHFVWENGAHHALAHLFGLDDGGAMEGPTTPDLEWPTWIIYIAWLFYGWLVISGQVSNDVAQPAVAGQANITDH